MNLMTQDLTWKAAPRKSETALVTPIAAVNRLFDPDSDPLSLAAKASGSWVKLEPENRGLGCKVESNLC